MCGVVPDDACLVPAHGYAGQLRSVYQPPLQECGTGKHFSVNSAVRLRVLWGNEKQ